MYGAINYNHRISSSAATASSAAEVQQLFNLGMVLAAGYNQPEARRTFRAALQVDNLCAMCWWGVAYARGPFQNKVALSPPEEEDTDDGLYYSQRDSQNAVVAIGYAAALAGLLYHNETEPTMQAIASQLGSQLPEQQKQQTQPQGQETQGQQTQGQTQGQGGVKRLMERLRKCPRQPPGSGSAESGAGTEMEPGMEIGTGRGRRRQRLQRRRLLDSHEGAGGAGGGQDGGNVTTAPVTNATGSPTPVAPLTNATSSPALVASPQPPAPPLPLPPSPRASRGPALRKEQYYIAAMFDRLSVRVVSGPLWAAAERRYAQDMQDVANCFPHDADALALAAEALANLSPWEFVVNGTDLGAESAPRNITKEVIALLQESLARNASQPLALHLMIHVTEQLPATHLTNTTNTNTATTTTEYVAGLGLDAANRLSGAFPSLDHLQHMPSHTYVRLGMWDEAVQSNVLALRASVNASWACLSPAYPEHNAAMAVFAACMAAQYDTAQVYARVLREMPRIIPDSDNSVGLLWPSPLLVAVLFGKWTRVASEPPPPVDSISDRDDLHALRTQLQAALDAVPKGSETAATTGAGGGSGSEAAAAMPADVLDEPALDAAILKGVLSGYAGRSGGGVGDGGSAGPRRPRAWDASADYLLTSSDVKAAAGPKLPVAVWLYAQAMTLANQLAQENQIAEELNGGPHASRPPPAPAAQKTESDASSLVEQAAASMAAGGGGGGGAAGGGAVAAKRADDARLLGRIMERLRAVARQEMRKDPAVPPGPGLGVAVPGYSLVAEVMYKMADARVAFANGNKTRALQSLREAVEAEDSGGYTEPPRLAQQPARQCLGWVQLREAMYTDAIQTYLDDLARYPGNAWSVMGLLRITNIFLDPAAIGKLISGSDDPQLLQAALVRADGALQQVALATKVLAARLDSSCPAFAMKLKA